MNSSKPEDFRKQFATAKGRRIQTSEYEEPLWQKALCFVTNARNMI